MWHPLGLQIARVRIMPTLQTPVSQNDFHQGQLDAPLQLVHYGDFECPYSRALSASIAQIQSEEGDKLLYVFRPFPLDDIHPHALVAARAAYAANDQNQFWPMYDALFQQNALGPTFLKIYAQKIGLDTDQFDSDFRSDKYDALIQTSVQDGRASGAHGTPTVFINGHFHDNREALWKIERLRAAIKDAR